MIRKLLEQWLVVKVIKPAWVFLEPIIELSIYVSIACILSNLLSITFMHSIIIVFTYFVLNLTRTYLTILRDKT